MFNRFIVLFLVCLLASGPVWAKTYKVALAQIPPYAMKGKEGATGILVDLTRETFKRMGQEVEFNFVPWARAIQYVQIGRVDAIAPFFRNREREDYVHFPPKGLVDMELSLFQKKDQGLKIKVLEDAIGYRVVKVNKASLGDKFSRLVDEGLLKLEVVQNTDLGINVLLAGRADYLASVKNIALYAAKNSGKASLIEVAGPALDVMDAYLAFSKVTTDQKFVDRFYAEFVKLQKSGYHKQIVKQYLD